MIKLDLHAERVEEALDRVARFLDEAVFRNESEALIIHGHGKGLLKRAVRHYLSTSPYASGFRAGYPSEGGDGATVVTLRE
ncbi:MAG: Smr/MutS family protein [Nitrospirae bacterium]|nr:Smr/MutS family protein [Candidatus Troglogloeales bacterium]